MIEREAKKLLFDILSSAETILGITAGRNETDLANDRALRSACLWEFTVIGEAINRLRQKFPEVVVRVGEYERIVAFRNQLVHGYDIIRDDITWRIIQTKLPVLKSDVVALLDDVRSD